MIREVRIETMQQVMDLIAGQQYRQDLKRHRDLRIYRGENNSAFQCWKNRSSRGMYGNR